MANEQSPACDDPVPFANEKEKLYALMSVRGVTVPDTVHGPRVPPNAAVTVHVRTPASEIVKLDPAVRENSPGSVTR
jgi:hypothetical protein